MSERLEIEVCREPVSTFDSDSNEASYRVVSDYFSSENEARQLKEKIDKAIEKLMKKEYEEMMRI